jgi:broad specificity phosphatase PhoE
MFRSSALVHPLKNQYIFVRHGQTTANAAKVYAGDTDVELTDRGRQQAAELASKLPGSITVVYCSPLQRALKTAEIALQPRGFNLVQCTIDERLKEKAGGVISGMTYDDIARVYPKEWDRDSTPFEESLNTAFPGGESDMDVVKRLEGFLLDTEAKYKDEVIAVVCHAGVMLAARYLFGQSEQEVFADIPSCGVDVYS